MVHLHAREVEVERPNGTLLKLVAPLPDHMVKAWEFLGSIRKLGQKCRARHSRRSSSTLKRIASPSSGLLVQAMNEAGIAASGHGHCAVKISRTVCNRRVKRLVAYAAGSRQSGSRCVKRFYKAPHWCGGERLYVLLDGRPVRTPAKAPAAAGLAVIAAEWNGGGENCPGSSVSCRCTRTGIDRVTP